MLLSRISDCKLQMRTKSQTGLQCWEAEFLAHLVELKGHEHVAKAVTVGINSYFFICFLGLWRINDENLKSDYLTWNWHQNKMYTRCLCLSFGSIKLLLS